MEKSHKAMSNDDQRSAAALPRGANVSRAYGAEDEGRAVARIESCAGGNRRFWKRADGIWRGQRSAMRVLLDVDENATDRAARDGPFVGYQTRMFGGYRASNDFRESAQLLVGVHRLDWHINVNSRCAGSFQKAGHAQFFQLFMKSSSDRDSNGEIGALGRIKIEKEIIGVVDIGVAAGPGIMVDATEAGQEEEGSAIVRSGVVDFFAQSFRVDRNCFEPLRNTLA